MPTSPDALVIVDVQRDFLPGGALAVPRGNEVVPVLNRYLAYAAEHGWPVFATRDWHPPDHCSFESQGGPWPVHCVADTEGARFAEGLDLPSETMVISKGTDPNREAYSGFERTELEERLKELGVRRLWVGGLATDYCVRQTVLDGLRRGFDVRLLTDAIRAVNVHPEDGDRAIDEMIAGGARPATLEDLP